MPNTMTGLDCCAARESTCSFRADIPASFSIFANLQQVVRVQCAVRIPHKLDALDCLREPASRLNPGFCDGFTFEQDAEFAGEET